MTRTPTGFVPTSDSEVNPEQDQRFLEKLLEQYEAIPCTLLTDRCGTNFFVINEDGKTLVLQLRTD